MESDTVETDDMSASIMERFESCSLTLDLCASDFFGHSLALIKLEKRRFERWAEDIKLRSLESRLQKTPDVADAILTLLGDLLARLKDARRIGTSPPKAPNRVGSKSRQLNLAPGRLASSNSGEHLARMDQNRAHGLKMATKAIDELYKFVAIVPTDDIMQNTLSQAMTWRVLDQYGLDIDTDLEDFVCGEIRRWIPDHNPKVLKRISEATCLRIRHFQCDAFYSRQGYYQPAGDLKPSSRTTLPHKSRSTGQHTSSDSASRLGIEGLVTDGSEMSNFPSCKTDLSRSNAADPLGIDSLVQKVNEFLTPPKKEDITSLCLCQYCGSQLLDQPPSPIRWKAHVLSDLRPYVCIFEECKYPNELFATVEDWMDHLHKPHISKWVCPTHSTAQESTESLDWGFASSDGFKAHLEQFHGNVMSDSRISMLVKTCHLHVKSRPSWPACNLNFQSSFHRDEKTFHGDDYFHTIADGLLALAMIFPPWDSSSLEFKKRPVMEDFFHWIDRTSSCGHLDMFSEKYVRFVPKDAMDQYLGDRHVLERLLKQHGFTDDRILSIVPDQYPKTFAILLVIRRGYLIADFVEQDKIDDSALPFKTRPAGFPNPYYALDIFQEFYEAQWQFCSPVLSSQADDICFSSDCILPVVYKAHVASVEGATLHEAWIHKAHSLNSLGEKSFREPHHTLVNTVYVKTYRSKDAESYYRNEVRALRMLQSLLPDKKTGILEFYGNFVHGDTLNILLEFADFGVLEHYLQSLSAPRTSEQIKSFWNGMLGLLSALECIHDTTELQELQKADGWFPDIRPGNILVFSSSDSIYQYRFKLSYLGLTQFKQQSFQWTQKYTADIHRAEVYYPPEFHNSTPHNEGSPVRRRKADIWSLGCVFSEALSWTAFGQDGLEKFRSIRREETRSLPSPADIGCFHDGYAVLKEVLEYQESAALIKREPMLVEIHRVIRKMLSQADDRPSSAELLTNTHALLRKEEKASLAAMKAMEHRCSVSGSSHTSYSPRILTEPSIASTQTPPSSAHSSSTSLNPKSRPNQVIAMEKGRPIQSNIPNLSEAEEPTEIPHYPIRPAGSVLSNATPEQFTSKTANARKTSLVRHSWTLDFLEASTQISLSSSKRWWAKTDNFFDQKLPEVLLNRLKERNHVFMIDISSSTENQWGKVEEFLKVLTHIIRKAKPTSTSFHFSSAHEMKMAEKKLKTAGVKTKDTYGADTEQDISARLIDVAEKEYFEPLATIRDRSTSRRFRRVQKKSTATSLYVLTDRPWGSDDHLKSTLEALAERLTRLNIGANDFGIQFVCFKDDQELMSRMQSLAKDVNKKRHIVDAEYWTGNVWKMFFGSFTPRFDEKLA